MKKNKTPYFLWDYDLSEQKVKSELKSGDEASRLFLIARILESARYEDVWQYLTLDEILAVFSRLKLKRAVKNAWEKAFTAWQVGNYSYEKLNRASK